MDIRSEFIKIMSEADTIALASSVDNIPNVRFLNFIYSADEKLLYFQSAKGSEKASEFEKNANVALVTLGANNDAHVRVTRANVKLSNKTIYDMQNAFIEKMPFYKDLIEKYGDTMNLYEVHFSTILVFPDVNIHKNL